MVLAVELFLGLDAVSLWARVLRFLGLDVGSRNRVGAVLGHLVQFRFVLWLGTSAAVVRICHGRRPHLWWWQRWGQFWIWPRQQLLDLRPAFIRVQFPAALLLRA